MAADKDFTSEPSFTDSSFRWRRGELARRVAFIYLVLSLAWILVSDRVAYLLAGSATNLAIVETLKGAIFICMTAVLIYMLIDRGLRKQEAVDKGTRRASALIIHSDRQSAGHRLPLPE